MKKFKRLKKERNETNGVIIERIGESVEIFFKPNEAGEHARKQYELLYKSIRG